jgi:uncharacterized membrane protein YhaH (DUF805 family)
MKLALFVTLKNIFMALRKLPELGMPKWIAFLLTPDFLDVILILMSIVGHYNCLINSNNQVKHKLSTQGSLLFQR